MAKKKKKGAASATKRVKVNVKVNKDAPEIVTTSLDAPTIFVDGIKGTMATGETMRVSFFEDKLNVLDDEVRRRHVVTLVAGRNQFKRIAEHLNRLVENIEVAIKDEGSEDA